MIFFYSGDRESLKKEEKSHSKRNEKNGSRPLFFVEKGTWRIEGWTYLNSSRSSKNRSRVIPAVVILVLMWVTGTSRGLLFMTRGLLAPGFVMIM